MNLLVKSVILLLISFVTEVAQSFIAEAVIDGVSIDGK
jgi:hypothetical protein